MAATRTCKLCGFTTTRLAQHIADEHSEYLEDSENLTERLKDVFGVCHWTAHRARKLAGYRRVKYCPRCGKERKGMVAHLLECHMPLLLCARYTLKLEQKDVSKMFFNGEISCNDISHAFQTLFKNDDVTCSVEREDLPQFGVPIRLDGSTVRVMEVGEVGRGFIFADPGVSWQV